MSRFFQNAALPLTLAICVTLAGCGGERQMEAGPVEIREYREVEDFTFTDQRNQAVERADLLGKVWVANFVFTSCAAECLVLSRRMGELQERFADREDFALASFSVDPQTDNPERLAEYAAQWNADAEQWHFFTGKPKDLDTIIKQSFLLPVASTPSEQKDIIISNFIHSNKLAVVDRQGVVRAYVDGMREDAVKEVSRVVETLLKEAPQAQANSGS